jgi:hypothetical protein
VVLLNKEAMNKLFSILLVATVIVACSENKTPKASPDLVNNPATADTTNQPKAGSEKGAMISFEKTTHDFGTIIQGEEAEYNFKFTNTGDEDLIISAANASCGCTVPEYPKYPIAPGASGFIKVKFNSDYRLDAFEKSVTITANTAPLSTVLIIKGFINPKPSTEPTSPIH